jgi:hypothetical protein
MIFYNLNAPHFLLMILHASRFFVDDSHSSPIKITGDAYYTSYFLDTTLCTSLRLRSTLLRSTPPTLVMSTITIPPTSRPRAGTNAPSCSERACKSDEQRAQEKEHKLARKVKIKAAVDVAIDQIDDIIEGLAAETGIGFKQACSYVHLGGRIFKGRRRPSIQNAYRFCSARVEDGRCEYMYFAAASA